MSLFDQMLPGVVFTPGLFGQMLPGGAVLAAPAAVPAIQVVMGVGFVPVPGPQGLPGTVAATLPYANLTSVPAAFTPTTYTFAQSVAAQVWTIAHNLGRVPQVTVIDSSGKRVYGSERLPTPGNVNILELSFGAAFAGTAFLI